MAWNRITEDLASAGTGGWRMHRPDGGAALLLGTAYVLDATVEDAIVVLPSARENDGRTVWGKRVDAPTTMFVAEFVPIDTSESIEFASSYSFASQGASVVLVGTAAGVWLIQSEIL